MTGRKALVVLGMHRTGTSALARVLSMRGADLPPHLMSANEGNASGYWEPAPVVALNDLILDYFGTAWDDPFAAFQIPGASLFPKKFQQRAARILEQEYGDSTMFILKDPRACLLSGFWLDALARMDVQACPIVIARPYAEVAASLHARDKSNLPSSVLLYVAYCLELATAHPGRATSFLRYDQLLADWRGATDRIAAEQGITWSRSGAFLDAEVSEFLVHGPAKPSAVHLSPRLQSWADTVWQWLVDRSEGKAPDIGPLLGIRDLLAEDAQTFSPLMAVKRQRLKTALASQAEAEAASAERHAAYLDSQAVLVRAAHDRDELLDERNRLLAAHERFRSEAAERNAAFADLLAERNKLLGMYQSGKAAVTDAAGHLDQLQAERGQLQAAATDLQARFEESQHSLRALLDEATQLRERVLRLEQEADTYHAERDKALMVYESTNATLHSTEAAFQALAAEADTLRAQREAQAQASAVQAQAFAGLREKYETTQAELMATQDVLRASVAAGDKTRAHLQELLAEASLLRVQVAEQAQAAAEQAQAAAEQAQAAAAERQDLQAAAALHKLEVGQMRESMVKVETLRATQASEAKRAQRELENTRSELRRAQDAIAQLRASHSWRITAPLRSLTTAGRKLLEVSRHSLRRPKDLLALAPPESAAGQPADAPAAPRDASTEPAYARRKHASLRTFLTAEFGDGAAAEMLLRIDRFRLPVETDQVRSASTISCSVEEARYWAAAIARRAHQDAGSEPFQPDVSIVVPVYNQVQFTLACVDALLSHATRYRFEILIGDDASTDATAQAFENHIPGVRYFRHDSNLGFVRNCNATARAARGRYVVMLNNDALVLPGWLDELIDVLEGNESVGLAGSKLIYPDGRMQECGAIVWRDGSAWNFGRLDDPRRPEHNYLRGVDFVSGASIALPTALWKRLGGFDEHFVPAYAEDADLAFRVRAEGLYTLVQPLSQVLHFEGVSSGTDLGQGAKAYQTANLGKLYERWKDVLAGHRENAQFPELEKERDTYKRMLFIDHCTLTPNEDAGSLVAFEILKTFRRFGFKVTFIPEDNFAHMGEDTRVLQRLGVETIYHPSYSRMDQFLAARHDDFDVILMHRFTVGDKHMAALKAQFPAAKFIFLACDLHYLRELREAEMAGDMAAINRANQTKLRELAVASASDAVVVYSDIERDMVQAEIPTSNVVLFPLVHDPVSDPMPLSARDGVCFVGGYRHPPNADAILWFVDQVWPLVYSRCPSAVLYVAGSHMTDAVKALGSRPGVEITGFVPDMESFLARRRVNIAPLRFGAGVKGKVSASLANGLPTVGTSIAAEGMLLTPGENILVADAAADFADRVVELLTQDARWKEVSEAGLRYAAEVTSSASAQERIRSMLNDLRVTG
ncbi:MAG: glycosyltransferase [Gammaproteobacteria bacterium]|nr:glycosyltransferase [Gammaproteobacteria bacterium]